MQFSAKEVFLMLRDVGASNETIAAKLGVTVRCIQQWEQLRKKGDLLKKPIPGRSPLWLVIETLEGRHHEPGRRTKCE